MAHLSMHEGRNKSKFVQTGTNTLDITSTKHRNKYGMQRQKARITFELEHGTAQI